MILTNELRIGSIVKCKVSNDAAFYTVIRIDGIYNKIMLDGARQGEWYTTDKLKPIKLTPEILEKCSFKKTKFDNGKLIGEEYSLSINEDEFKLFFGWYWANKNWTVFKIISNGCYDEAGEMSINETCKNVHQLQNLYFALTGTELEVKK